MKKAVLYFVLIVFSIPSINAQFICDFEDCVTGQPNICLIYNPFSNLCSQDQNHTSNGMYSGLIPGDGTTDAILDLENKIFGTWGLKFWMYIPSDREGYFNVQGAVPITTGIWAIGNIFFNEDNVNPGAGYIDYSAFNNPELWDHFTFPHDQWFEVILNVDISTGMSSSTFQFIVDGVTVADWKPFASYDVDLNLVYPPALGGIDFFSISTNNEYYLDDFLFQDSFIILSTSDLISKQFSSYPNPVNNELHISANEIISNVSIYNMLGQEIYTKDIDEMDYVIDTSNLTNGAYFATVTIGNSIEKLKIVKL